MKMTAIIIAILKIRKGSLLTNNSTWHQRTWFVEFRTRKHRYMFVADLNDKAIGCRGIRLLDYVRDIHNVIFGEAKYCKYFVLKAFM